MPRLARAAGCALIAAVCLLWALPLPARADASPDAALTQLLAAAHAEATPRKCAERGIDRLVRIMCSGHIRIGVRDEYPLFATHTGATWQGYEIDIARAVGQKLGVAVDFVSVKAATRVPVVASGEKPCFAEQGADALRGGGGPLGGSGRGLLVVGVHVAVRDSDPDVCRSAGES